jgi:hypothetical protein
MHVSTFEEYQYVHRKNEILCGYRCRILEHLMACFDGSVFTLIYIIDNRMGQEGLMNLKLNNNHFINYNN